MISLSRRLALRLLLFLTISNMILIHTEADDKTAAKVPDDKAKVPVATTKPPVATTKAPVTLKKPTLKPKPTTTKKTTRKPKPTEPPLPKEASFDEWSEWKKQFPMCNPRKNPTLSPIKIDTKSAIPEKDVQTLIVYSGPPLGEAYTFSSYYNTDGVKIEAINIGLRNEFYRDATYVSGLGNPEYRFFQRALILFSQQDGNPERSLHQIDGKKFQAEIVMYFKDLRQTDTTQIHVMVQKKEEINPAWHWLPEAVVALNNLLFETGIDETKAVKEAQIKEAEARQAYNETLDQEKKDTGEDGYEATYQDLSILYNLVQEATNTTGLEKTEKKLEGDLKRLEGISGEFQEVKKEKETELDEQLNKISRQIAAGLRTSHDEDAETDKVDMLRAEIKSIQANITKLHNSWTTRNKKYYDTKQKLKNLKGLLEQYKIGTGKNMNFPNVEAVKVKLDDMEEKAEDIAKKREEHLSALGEVENAQAQIPQDVGILNLFQISWLLPAIGGFYRYNGSGVVPPCNPRTHVIVMEKYITISPEQLGFLYGVLRGRNKQQIEDDLADHANDDPPWSVYNNDIQKLDDLLPSLMELESRKIYHNPKNLQFKLDDGFHMKSSVRRKIKDSMKKSEGVNFNGNFKHFGILFIMSVLHFGTFLSNR